MTAIEKPARRTGAPRSGYYISSRFDSQGRRTQEALRDAGCGRLGAFKPHRPHTSTHKPELHRTTYYNYNEPFSILVGGGAKAGQERHQLTLTQEDNSQTTSFLKPSLPALSTETHRDSPFAVRIISTLFASLSHNASTRPPCRL